MLIYLLPSTFNICKQIEKLEMFSFLLHFILQMFVCVRILEKLLYILLSKITLFPYRLDGQFCAFEIEKKNETCKHVYHFEEFCCALHLISYLIFYSVISRLFTYNDGKKNANLNKLHE